MALVDEIEADLPVFLNTDEFAALRTVELASGNGAYPINCVLDDEELVEDRDSPGVYRRESTLHLRLADLTHEPAVNERLTLDDRLSTVVGVSEAMGMLSIRLRWFES